MIRIWLTIVFRVLILTALGQPTVNQITIFPENPTETDTIYVAVDMTYQGACDYGIVYNYDWQSGDTIFTMPTYCGHWDSTWCFNRLDTFKINPYPVGDYFLKIQFHQGSVCPISNFDAVITNFDTTLSIGPSTGMGEWKDDQVLNVYPNPTSGIVYIDLGKPTFETMILTVYNSLGQTVLMQEITNDKEVLDFKEINGKGLYTISIVSTKTGLAARNKVLVD